MLSTSQSYKKTRFLSREKRFLAMCRPSQEIQPQLQLSAFLLWTSAPVPACEGSLGAVGIEPGRPSNSQCLRMSKPHLNLACPAYVKRLGIFGIQSPPSAASAIQQSLAVSIRSTVRDVGYKPTTSSGIP